MIRALIERLQQKPRHTRVHLSLIGAIVTTGMIATLWGVALPTRIAAISGEEQARTGWGVVSLFESARGNVAQLIGALQGGAEDAPPPRETESGTYRAGAPADATSSDFRYAPGRDAPAAVPTERRQVQIATTTREQ